MASIIRADVSRILLFWLVAGHLLWLASPWGEALEQLLGPAWLWCGLMPGAAWAIVSPRSAAASVARALRTACAAATVLWRAVAGLRPAEPVMFLYGQQNRRSAGVVHSGGTGEQKL